MVSFEAPDKGRAWVVALAACVINMILSGLARVVSMIYVAILDRYDVKRAKATLPFTIRSSVTCLSGPLVGVVGERFGARAVTFYGGLMAAIGTAMCCIAPNVIWMTFFWGGLHGIGFAMATTFFQVVVNQHFQKYRATASGIALSGAGVGSFCLPILIEWLMSIYGLSGLFLVLGGVILHVLPPSLLLSTPLWVKQPEAYKRICKLKKPNAVLMEDDLKGRTMESKDQSLTNHELSFVKLDEIIRTDTSFGGNLGTSSESFYEQDDIGGISDYKLDMVKKKGFTRKNNVTCTRYTMKEIVLLGNVTNLHNNPKNNNTNSDIFIISNQVQAKVPICDTEETVPTSPKTPKNHTTYIESMKKTVNLYLNPMYVFISFCMVTYNLIYNPTITVLVDYGKDKGLADSYGKYLINAMSIGDLTGRLCFGWVTDKEVIQLPFFMCLMFLLQGTSIVLLPSASSFYVFVLLLVLYSMAAGCIFVHFPVLVLQYVNLESQSVAMACVKFMSGLVSFGMPSMIGHFRDDVGSYDGMFYLTGTVSIFCAGVWLLVPTILKFQNRTKS